MAKAYGTTSFELLAPAGSLPILKEVVAAGADAVYVGGSRFGARAYAQNFSDEELCEAIDYVHLHGRKLYLTVNTLLKNSEIGELCDYIRPLYERGLDAVIVQDFGVMHLLRREFPDLPLHASTQMTVTGVDGTRMLGELGLSRVVLSRELSIAEMARIRKETGMELEVFVHGALCYSYSGQCLFSSMLGGRSGNRGRCAQPCRLPYEICGCNQASYVLSLKDLCGIDDLAALREAGVYSLKIEGRMKQAAYAAGVTAYYRKYIDALEGPDMPEGREDTCCNLKKSAIAGGKSYSDGVMISQDDRQGLLALGNRSGFTDGYYHRRNGSDMVTFEKPAYTRLKPGEEAINAGAAAAAYQSAEAQSYKHLNPEGDKMPSERKISIRGWAYFHKGEASYITVSTDNADYLERYDHTPAVTVTGQEPQAAAKAPVTGEQIRQRLQKTGDTPFVFEELTVDADEGIFIPNGELNRMRREALAQLQEKMLEPYRRQKVSDKESIDIGYKRAEVTDKLRIIVSVSSLKQLEAVLEDDRVTDIYLETVSYPRAQLMDMLHKAVKLIETGAQNAPAAAELMNFGSAEPNVANTAETFAIYLALPPIFRAHTESFYSNLADEIKKLPIKGFLIRNYEEFAWVGRMFPGYRRILDANLYTYNDEASEAFATLGADGNTVPLELNRREIMARDNRCSEMVVYGYYPLMVSAQCVHTNTARGCDRKPGITYIRDRKGIDFPVRNFCSECVNIVYNSLPTVLISRMDELKSAGIRGFRLDFTIEDAEMVHKVLGILPGNFKYTKGHYLRGVE